MTKKGYIQRRKFDMRLEEEIKWMEDYGCTTILKESFIQEEDRPLFKQMVMNLCEGDEIVITALSNAFRDFSDITIFMNMCKHLHIRLISIHDRLDTGDELFQDTKHSDIFDIIGRFSMEVHNLRINTQGVLKVENTIERIIKNKESRENKKKIELMVVNMYNDKYSLIDICEKLGIKHHSQIFRILQRYGISPNRRYAL